ncbi:hypothetical protein L218DRAFT_951166 [Marasmius fiardii PR-910]|nr:hypothetical protein L218DRAFT_951166 [Marasmius fiardii PR-910]
MSDVRSLVWWELYLIFANVFRKLDVAAHEPQPEMVRFRDYILVVVNDTTAKNIAFTNLTSTAIRLLRGLTLPNYRKRSDRWPTRINGGRELLEDGPLIKKKWCGEVPTSGCRAAPRPSF